MIVCLFCSVPKLLIRYPKRSGILPNKIAFTKKMI